MECQCIISTPICTPDFNTNKSYYFELKFDRRSAAFRFTASYRSREAARAGARRQAKKHGWSITEWIG